MDRGIPNKIRTPKPRGYLFWTSCAFWAFSAWWFLFPPPRSVVERWFSRRWYRLILDVAAPLTQSVNFPIVLALALCGLILFFAIWAIKWKRSRRLREPYRKGFLAGIRVLFLIIPVLLAWFIVFWGAGYRRLPVEERLHLDSAPVSDSEAGRLRELLLEEVKSNAVTFGTRDPDRAIRSIAASMARMVSEWDGRGIDLPSRVKPMPAGLLLSGGASGMCAPFTLEALVDSGLPETAFVSSAAHELGHVAGFCPEDEASFAGYISGLRADDRFARYACALNAYMDLIGPLNPGDFKRAVESLPETARRDLAQADESYRRYRIRWFSRISWTVYDRYLQAQGIKEGVRNYSHGITLLAYAWRKGIPINVGPKVPVQKARQSIAQGGGASAASTGTLWFPVMKEGALKGDTKTCAAPAPTCGAQNTERTGLDALAGAPWSTAACCRTGVYTFPAWIFRAEGTEQQSPGQGREAAAALGGIPTIVRLQGRHRFYTP